MSICALRTLAGNVQCGAPCTWARWGAVLPHAAYTPPTQPGDDNRPECVFHSDEHPAKNHITADSADGDAATKQLSCLNYNAHTDLHRPTSPAHLHVAIEQRSGLVVTLLLDQYSTMRRFGPMGVGPWGLGEKQGRPRAPIRLSPLIQMQELH